MIFQTSYNKQAYYSTAKKVMFISNLAIDTNVFFFIKFIVNIVLMITSIFWRKND